MWQATSIVGDPGGYGSWIRRAKSWAALSTGHPPPRISPLAVMTGKPCTSPAGPTWPPSMRRFPASRCRPRKIAVVLDPFPREACVSTDATRGGVSGPSFLFPGVFRNVWYTALSRIVLVSRALLSSQSPQTGKGARAPQDYAASWVALLYVLATQSGADVDRTLMRMLSKPINLGGLVPG
jgi:hypothetical protein